MLRQLLRNPLGLVGRRPAAAGGADGGVRAPAGAVLARPQVHFDTPFQRPFTVGFPLGHRRPRPRRAVPHRLRHPRVPAGGAAVGAARRAWSAPRSAWSPATGAGCDAIVSRLTDLTLAFPFLIIAVGLAAINGASLTNAAVALGIAQVPTMIRVVRAETLRYKELDFVLAARSLDASGRADPAPAHPAQRGLGGDRAGHGDHAGGGDRRGAAVVPRAGHPAADAEPRDHAVRRTAVHLPGAERRGLPGPRDRRDLPGLQPVRRRAARRPRPQHSQR